MAPRAHRRKLAAAALAAACAVVYLWMLFAWETAWGIDLKHRDSPPWLVGTFWVPRTVKYGAWALLLAAAAGADVNSTYQCGRLDRVGPPSEGGKYV